MSSCSLHGRQTSPQLEAFLRVDEILTDIADDLHDYEKDVGKNSFNVLRGAVHAVGEDAPLRIAEHIGRLEKQHEELLVTLSEDQQEAYCRCRAVAMGRRPGAEKWTFPPIMSPSQEVEYRLSVAHAEHSSMGSDGEDPNGMVGESALSWNICKETRM